MKLIIILGPTATGKTKLAAHFSYRMNGEIISADSRQVFKNMDIGTGKDLNDYIVNGTTIPSYLIDIKNAGEEFSVYDFQKEFINAYQTIIAKNKTPVLCGGTGLYLESVIKQYNFIKVDRNDELRATLSRKSDEELNNILQELKLVHNTTDSIDRERILRAIEIEEYGKLNPQYKNEMPLFNPVIFGINMERNLVKEKITNRLQERLKCGMIEEVKLLLDCGISPERLKYYGLEYKYITQYLMHEISYDEMVNLLNIAIHQFSKRQMTWFRRMEKKGIHINWIDGALPLEDKVQFIINKI